MTVFREGLIEPIYDKIYWMDITTFSTERKNVSKCNASINEQAFRPAGLKQIFTNSLNSLRNRPNYRCIRQENISLLILILKTKFPQSKTDSRQAVTLLQ